MALFYCHFVLKEALINNMCMCFCQSDSSPERAVQVIPEAGQTCRESADRQDHGVFSVVHHLA